MASPQLEDGFTRIANGLLEALARQRLGGIARAVVDAVLRETWGRPGSPKLAPLSVRRLGELIGVSRGRASEAVAGLLRGNMLVEGEPERPGGTRLLGFQKDFDGWRPLRGGSKNGRVPDGGYRGVPDGGHRGVPENGTEHASGTAPGADSRAPNTPKTRKTSSRRAAPRSERPPPDPRVKAFVDGWHDAYVAACGETPLIDGPKDGAHVKRMLGKVPLAELEGLRAIYFGRHKGGDRFFDAPSLAHFLTTAVLEKCRAFRRREACGSGARPANDLEDIWRACAGGDA